MEKIFFILPSLEGGGVEKFITRLSNALADKNYDISLIVIKDIDDYLDEVSNKVKVIRLNCKHMRSALLPLISFLKKNQPDIIFSTKTHLNVICLLAKILSNSSSKIFVRSDVVFHKTDPFKNKLTRLFARFLYPLASGVISPSQDVYNNHLEMGLKNKKMAVIYNFVDKPHLKALAAMPSDLPFESASPLIIAAGRLSLNKNYAYLIQSFKIFCEQYAYPNAKLIILGKGPEQAHLDALILKLNLQDKVFLKGFLKNPYPYFAKADLFAHTSKVEGLANVLLAALALERNIVCTDCAGAHEALANGKYGHLVPITDDPHVFAKAMHQALQTPIHPALLQESIQSRRVETIVQQYISFMGLKSCVE